MVPFYCAIQVGFKDTEGMHKEKIELEGFVINVNYYPENCELKIRNYDDDEVYRVTIKNELLDTIPNLRQEQLIRVKGFLPDRYEETRVEALKVKIL